jgi:hypothetical protein
MIDSFFRYGDEDAFYDQPPVAYGVVGTVPFGYMVAHEWVGKIITTQVSKAFMLGSPDHVAACSDLQVVEYADPTHLADVPLVKDEDRNIAWSSSPYHGKFYKVVHADAFDAAYFVNASKVYRHYWQVCTTVTMPPVLVTARILYGSFAIAVEMDFIAGARATEEQVKANGDIQDAVVEALVFLALNRLVHTDVRGPNVILGAAGRIALVDYDDCVLCDNPVQDYATFSTCVENSLASLHTAGMNATEDLRIKAVNLNYLHRYPALKAKLQGAFAAITPGATGSPPTTV